MASVNFLKLHTAQDVKAIIRHCDKDERQKHEHSNKQIRKELTCANADFDISYADTCRDYDARIAYLDSLPGANVRKDRVTCFSLEIPCPADLSEDKCVGWVTDLCELLLDRYGKANVLNMYYHVDEVHEYRDARTGQLTTSRPHVHALVIPEVGGKLVGKKFSSRDSMMELNSKIHEMSQNNHGVDFMDATARKQYQYTVTDENGNKKTKYVKKSVETLKNESREKEREAEYNARLSALEAREDAFKEKVKDKDNELKNLEISLKKQKKEIEERDKQSQDIYNALSKAQKEKPEVKLAFERLQEHLRKQAKKDEEDEKSAENGGYSR